MFRGKFPTRGMPASWRIGPSTIVSSLASFAVATTPSLTRRRAHAWARLGSAWSSQTSTSTGRPLTPPWALIARADARNAES